MSTERKTNERWFSGIPGIHQGDWDRRKFLKALGAGASMFTLPWSAMAGPFTRSDFEQLVPSDKKLRPEWVKSLSERGEPTIYRGMDLESIGMPIGGLCAGQVYLGGDGKLWHWDIFNRRIATDAGHYAKPLKAASPLEQGFALRITSGGKTQERVLERTHWRDVSFRGQYPMGYVDYHDPDSPINVSLRAFSPFIPLNTDDSSLPATIMEFTLFNRSGTELEVELAGWLENAVCLNSSATQDGLRRNRLVRRKGMLCLECSAKPAPNSAPVGRPDIVFEDFEHETYGDWTVTGNAFGAGPVEISKIHSYQGDVAGKGKRVVNTHASPAGDTVEARDAATGTLTSPTFTIARDYILLLVGGGAHKGKTCVNLLIEDQAVLTVTGQDNNKMQPVSWDVRPWMGKLARIQIVDQESGPWGNIGVDDIIFSDRPHRPPGPLETEPDFGTLCLALLDPQSADFGVAGLPGGGAPAGIFSTVRANSEPMERKFGEKLVGSVTRKLKLRPGTITKAVTFVLTWHMPNLTIHPLPPRRHYATRFESAPAVAEYIRQNFERLESDTRIWHDTWYDSTLPHWFLDRTFLNTSILATSTCFRLGDGRFYAWEGVGCCEGTCGHVWQYAHAAARLFPELERMTREKVDFGLALQPDGAIHFRGEFNDFAAIDAQAGTILRAMREHQVSADDAFLKRTWPRIRRATEWLIAKDGNDDGIIESNQHNTLDTDWFGPVAWLSGLYLAALLAAETMAEEIDDTEFARKCRTILKAGQKNIVAQLFEDDYFKNKPDPAHPEAINSGSGCEIDQVLGQSWAFQVGLPRVLPEKETLSALKSLWRYNFTPDVGPYRQTYKPGRWYAMPGEAGLLMCTFPRSDWDYAQAKGKGPEWAAGYFNECMNGFEYQVAGHMIWEGLVTEGLAVTRAVHDRYHASRRNPWNEVECGDHYARSMASYGVFLAACGFEYHGPRGHLGFAPRVFPPAPANAFFQSAFTTAEGWGSYSQRFETGSQKSEITLKWGKLRIRSLALGLPKDFKPTRVKLELAKSPLKAELIVKGERAEILLARDALLKEGENYLIITLS